jgi:hypothetical protein
MLASQSQLIAGPILADVLRVCLGEALNGRINGCHSSLFPHALCGEVGVCSSTWASAPHYKLWKWLPRIGIHIVLAASQTVCTSTRRTSGMLHVCDMLGVHVMRFLIYTHYSKHDCWNAKQVIGQRWVSRQNGLTDNVQNQAGNVQRTKAATQIATQTAQLDTFLPLSFWYAKLDDWVIKLDD